MTNDQLEEIEKKLDLRTGTIRVEITIKGNSLHDLSGEYHREENSNIVRLRQGSMLRYIDTDAIVAIGVLKI